VTLDLEEDKVGIKVNVLFSSWRKRYFEREKKRRKRKDDETAPVRSRK
jgi:hypothetical protein